MVSLKLTVASTALSPTSSVLTFSRLVIVGLKRNSVSTVKKFYSLYHILRWYTEVVIVRTGP